MKKLISILIGLALVISVNAQFQNSGGMFLRTGSSFTTAQQPTTPPGPVRTGSSFTTAQQPTTPPGPVPLPAFVTTDGHTFGMYEAKAANITMDEDRVLTLTDISGNNHPMTGMYGTISYSIGPEWDAVNEELDFGTSTGHYILTTPTFTATSQITIYTVVRINNWVENGKIHLDISNGGFSASLTATQNDIVSYNGRWAFGLDNASTGVYGVLTARFTGGTTSVLQWNKRTRGIGDNGDRTNTSLSYGGNLNIPAEMSIKEIIIRMTADSDSNIDAIQSYLMSKYNISN